MLITRTRQMAEALAAREEAVADREAAVAAREEALAESARARDVGASPPPSRA